MLIKRILISCLVLISIMSYAYAGVVIGNYYAEIPCTTAQLPTEDGASIGDYDIAVSVDNNKYFATQFSYAGTNGKSICKITLWLDFTGSNAHSYYVAIYGNNAGADPDEPDESTVLGTSDVKDLSGIGAVEDDIDFTFSTPTSALANGTLYWIVFYSSTLDADDFAEWHYETAGATELIMRSGNNAAWAQQGSGTTLKFKLWSE